MTPPLRAPAVIVGGGPAGMALAAELGERGLPVVLLDPAPTPQLRNSYGIWTDEAAALGLQDCLISPSTCTRIELGGGRSHDLQRGYARVDQGLLLRHLIARCDDAGVERRVGTALSAEVHGDHATVALEGGGSIAASLVVDATGHGGALLEPAPPHDASFQVAYGRLLKVDALPFPEDTALLMDFSPVDDDDDEGPTFLYALHAGPGQLFVEETVLATQAPPTFDWLADRLDRRCTRMGIHGDLLDEERCRFPMGRPVPRLDQAVLGFGGAASLVHPATGYMIARALRLAGPLAELLTFRLDEGASPADAARAGWHALWNSDRLEGRALQVFGMSVVLDFDAKETRLFFNAFFASGDEAWRTYLDPDASARALAGVMLGMAAHLPAGMVARLMAEALKRPAVLPRLGRHFSSLLLRRKPRVTPSLRTSS